MLLFDGSFLLSVNDGIFFGQNKKQHADKFFNKQHYEQMLGEQQESSLIKTNQLNVDSQQPKMNLVPPENLNAVENIIPKPVDVNDNDTPNIPNTPINHSTLNSKNNSNNEKNSPNNNQVKPKLAANYNKPKPHRIWWNRFRDPVQWENPCNFFWDLSENNNNNNNIDNLNSDRIIKDEIKNFEYNSNYIDYMPKFCNISLSFEQRAKDLIYTYFGNNLTKLIGITGSQAHSQITLKNNDNDNDNIYSFVYDYQWWNEALHGVAKSPGVSYIAGDIHHTTMFPQVIGVSSSFNRTLWYKIGVAISTEARAMFNNKQAGLTFW